LLIKHDRLTVFLDVATLSRSGKAKTKKNYGDQGRRADYFFGTSSPDSFPLDLFAFCLGLLVAYNYLC